MLESWLIAVAVCFGLGTLHGVIPDEHTWPITFNYAVGAASSRGGLRAGMWFSLAFTVQRALMSEMMFLVFATFLYFDPAVNGPVYLAVGAAMAIAGWLILSNRERRFLPHLNFAYKGFERREALGVHERHEAEAERKLAQGGEMPVHWCLIHGFISGFGQDSGIFTVAVFVAAISAPSLAVGWLPGAAFGIGTFVILMMIGFLFGGALDAARRWGRKRIARFGRLVGARSLVSGGLIFFVMGGIYMVPRLADRIGVVIDYGTLIVILCMVGATLPILVYTWLEVKRDKSLDPSAPSSEAEAPEPTPLPAVAGVIPPGPSPPRLR